MIDEQDLYDLAHQPLGAGGQCRSVGDVFARGQSLRRRRRAMRDVGLVGVVGGLVAAGTLVLSDDRPEVRTGDDGSHPGPTEPTRPAGLEGLPTDMMSCVGTSAADLSVEEVADLALEPTWLPPGMAMYPLGGKQIDRGCLWAEPVLVLRSLAADGSVTGVIRVDAPFWDPTNVASSDWADVATTEVRGTRATPYSGPEDKTWVAAGFTWYAPPNVRWSVEGDGVDEPTMRAFTEALLLDPQPAAGSPVASIDPALVPAGFEIVSQSIGYPVVSGPTVRVWNVVSDDGSCRVRLGDSPRSFVVPSGGDPGDKLVVIRGHDGTAGEDSYGKTILQWEESPEVTAAVMCQVGLDDALQIAESLQPVAPVPPAGGD